MTEDIEPVIPAEFQKTEEDYKEKYLRLLAEIDNTRKRMQKEKQEMTRFSVENVISDLLAPIDNLENALQCTKNMSPDVLNWAIGFQMILGQFKDVLSNHGVSAFHSEGSLFDPRLHFAIEIEQTDKEPEGTILKEFVKGYRSGEHVIRPARVKVAATQQPHKQETEMSDSNQNPDVLA